MTDCGEPAPRVAGQEEVAGVGHGRERVAVDVGQQAEALDDTGAGPRRDGEDVGGCQVRSLVQHADEDVGHHEGGVEEEVEGCKIFFLL